MPIIYVYVYNIQNIIIRSDVEVRARSPERTRYTGPFTVRCTNEAQTPPFQHCRRLCSSTQTHIQIHPFVNSDTIFIFTCSSVVLALLSHSWSSPSPASFVIQSHQRQRVPSDVADAMLTLFLLCLLCRPSHVSSAVFSVGARRR